MRKKNRKYDINKFGANFIEKGTIRIEEFEKLCKLTQPQLKTMLTEKLKNDYKYDTVISNDGYVFAKGTVPVLLCAHMDTVHKELPKVITYKLNEKKQTVIHSPQGIGGDDRCGIYMALEILREIKCSVLFLEDEEIGCVGANKFAKDYGSKTSNRIKEVLTDGDIHYILEMDRKGSHDAVYYDLDNEDFENFITESSNGHFQTNYGSCSDISYLAPALNVAAVNLSCGYYKEHTLEHYVIADEMLKNIEKAKEIIKTPTEKPFEWKEIERYHGLLYDDYYGYGYSGYGYGKHGKKSSYQSFLEDDYDVYFYDRNGYVVCDTYTATSELEALGMCMVNHDKLCYDDVIDITLSFNGLYEADVYMSEGKEIKAWEEGR